MRRSTRDAQGMREDDTDDGRDVGDKHGRECSAAAGGPRDCDCGADERDPGDEDEEIVKADQREIARGIRLGATVGGWR